jgi:tetratricopeptide (TPR) repeat protein
MVRWLFLFLMISAVGAWAQNSSSSSPSSSSSSSSASAPLPDAPQPTNPQPPPNPPAQNKPTPPAQPKFTPPSSDHVDASALPQGESSSKDDDIDLSPPPGDAAAHPNSPSPFGAAAPGTDVNEMHPWDPHKAMKDIEVGDFYFKRKNYRAAESRYREALLYKNNDAVATYRLAVSLEKLDRPDEAREEYESYLKILPEGHEAEHARKALERLKSGAVKSNPGK